MYEGCIDKVKDTLDTLLGKGNWGVNINLPTKPLTIYSDTVSVDIIKEALNKLNYKAELI